MHTQYTVQSTRVMRMRTENKIIFTIESNNEAERLEESQKPRAKNPNINI